MTDDGPTPNDPLSPYSPSEAPAVPGDGRRWFAVLFSVLLLLGAAVGVVEFLFF